MRQLDVYYNDMKVGVLTEQNPGANYTFKYEEEYLLLNLPPISATLPKREKIFESESLFSFFSNMIPEGANRGVICRTFKIDERDVFGILCVMADKDFIGAINIRISQRTLRND